MILISIILFIFIICSIRKPTYGLAFLIATLSVSGEVLFGTDISLIIKILFFVSSLLCMLFYGIKIKYLRLYGYLLCFIVLSQLFASYGPNYTVINVVRAFVSLMIGILLLSIDFTEKDKFFFLKLLSLFPYLSIVLGLYGFHSLSFNGRYGAGTTSTNLSFLCAVSLIAALTLYNETKENKYLVSSSASFVICFLTLTRGGILFCILALLPFVIKILKKLKTNQVLILVMIFVIAIFVIIKNWQSLASRMYSNTGELNTSGRLEAWIYIIGLNTKKWVGSGIGKLNTLTLVGRYIDHFNAAHNEYVRFYYESGITGLFVLLTIFKNAFTNFFYGNNLSKFQNMMILLAFMIYSFVDNTISNHIFFIPFMLYLNVACLDENSKRMVFKWRRDQFVK